MSTLVRAVVLLDRPTVKVMAGRIADEETIARMPDKSKLPPELLAEQAGLQAAARQLAAAAQEDDDAQLADRFAALTRTCVTCHSVFLHGRPEDELGPLAPQDTPAAPKR